MISLLFEESTKEVCLRKIFFFEEHCFVLSEIQRDKDINTNICRGRGEEVRVPSDINI